MSLLKLQRESSRDLRDLYKLMPQNYTQVSWMIWAGHGTPWRAHNIKRTQLS